MTEADDSSAPPVSRRAALIWALVLILPNVFLAMWLFRAQNPWRVLFELYSFQDGLPLSYALPAIFLGLSAVCAWIKSKRAPAFSRTAAFVFSPLGAAVLFAGFILFLTLILGASFLANLLRAAWGGAILLSAAGIGLRALGNRFIKLNAARFESPLERLVLATTLGLGVLGLSVFGVCSFGVMNPWLWRAAILGLCALNFRELRPLSMDVFRAVEKRVVESNTFALATAVFVALFLFAHAPMMWNLPRDYDVLEYHLAAPAQYLRAGSISFLRENIYATFPENGEMLYLLGMILAGDKFAGLPGAHVVLLGAWVLTGLGVYALARRVERSLPDSPGRSASPAPIAAAALYALVPMGSHLASDFYVEHIQAMFHVAALLCGCAYLNDFKIMQLFKSHAQHSARSWLLCTGVFAGFCCGTKYLGLLFTLLPLLLFLPVYAALSTSLIDGLRTLLGLTLPALLAFAPWMLRNGLVSGDPLHPLGLSMRRRMSPAADLPDRIDHFEAAHRAGAISWRSLLDALLKLLPGLKNRGTKDEERMLRFFLMAKDDIALGPQLGFFAMPGLAAVKSAEAALVAFAFLLDLLLWFLVSLHNERFVYPLLTALAVLSGLGLSLVWRVAPLRKVAVGICCIAVLMFAPMQLGWVWLSSSTVSMSGSGEWLDTANAQFGGFLPTALSGSVCQVLLPERSRALFVGEAQTFYWDRTPSYSVVFNTSLLEEALQKTQSAAEAKAYLRERGITHFFINYDEWLRLDTSYALTFSETSARWQLVNWAEDPTLNTVRDTLAKQLRNHEFRKYIDAWPETFHPAYLKLSPGEYSRLEVLLLDESRLVWPLQPAGMELRELRP